MTSLHVQGSEVLYISFNQDYGCFAVGTDQGFRIYNCEPFKETFRRDFAHGGIGMVEMLFRCNILALVGGGASPRYQPNKVMIWDDHQNRCIGELAFKSDVRALRMRRDRVVVAVAHKVYVYNFEDLKLLDHLDTTANPRGLLALCPHPTSLVLACPGAHRGHVRVELYSQRKSTLIAAHETALACIALNADGSRVATASEKGTLIRIFDTESGELLQELRRGTERAEITSIAFNATSSMLACASDKGTVHIWKLRPEAVPSASGGSGAASAATSGGGAAGAAAGGGAGGEGGEGGGAAGSEDAPAAAASSTNSKSSLSFMKGLLPKYFSSEWSFAQFRVPDSRSVVAFGQEPNTIMVVSADGSFFRANFEKGGEAVRIAYSQFVAGEWSDV